MKRKFTQLATALVILSSLSSCATIVGGSNYNAHVQVLSRPHAKIIYNGQTRGIGMASIQVQRREANKFAFVVKEEGFEDQHISYSSRTFRGWALFGTIMTVFVSINNIPILPATLVLDLATGAFWKPNLNEKGIVKQNYKNFAYIVNEQPIPKAKPAMDLMALEDVLYLKNGLTVRGLIIEQEPSVQIKIRIKDGSVLVYKSDEVEKVMKEEQEKF